MSGRDTSANPFSLLADETRLGVIETIGDHSGGGEYATLPYSTIREALGDPDSGNLNYHLRKLRGRFVERTDDGYRLTVAGIRVYQAVVSESFEGERPTVPPTETDYECENCESSLVVSYEDGRYFARCLECEIRYQRYPLSPTAFDPDDVDSLVRAAVTRSYVDFVQMLAGVCPYCTGQVDRDVVADDTTGMSYEKWDVFGHLSCRECGWFNHSSVEMLAFYHPSTWVFFERRGVHDPQLMPVVPGERTTTVRSADPWDILVESTYDGDAIRHVVDGTPRVVEWEVTEA
jgi:hypothetical protein